DRCTFRSLQQADDLGLFRSGPRTGRPWCSGFGRDRQVPERAQRRRAAVLRSLNLDNGFAPGCAFQIATICAADNPLSSTSSTDLTRTSSSEMAGAEANAVTMCPRIM